MTAHHVLGILEDDESRLWAALDRAVAVADTEQARLTLAKTTDPGWLMRWFAPAAVQSMFVSADELDFRTIAGHKLARAAEFVPGWIPVTTLLLAQNTGRALLELISGGRYDVLVASESLLRRRRLGAAFTRLGMRTEPASACAPPRPPDHLRTYDMNGARR